MVYLGWSHHTNNIAKSRVKKIKNTTICLQCKKPTTATNGKKKYTVDLATNPKEQKSLSKIKVFTIIINPNLYFLRVKKKKKP